MWSEVEPLKWKFYFFCVFILWYMLWWMLRTCLCILWGQRCRLRQGGDPLSLQACLSYAFLGWIAYKLHEIVLSVCFRLVMVFITWAWNFLKFHAYCIVRCSSYIILMHLGMNNLELMFPHFIVHYMHNG